MGALLGGPIVQASPRDSPSPHFLWDFSGTKGDGWHESTRGGAEVMSLNEATRGEFFKKHSVVVALCMITRIYHVCFKRLYFVITFVYDI